jgi:predicted phosphodiesterase
VHGNLAALDAVLREVPNDALVVVGGDVAAGPYPQEAVDRLRALGDRVRFIRGNADRELGQEEPRRAPADVIEWVRSRLDADTMAWLHALPPTLELDVDGVGRVLFCHATPENDEDIFTERTPEANIAGQFAVDVDLVVCGHTHTQFERWIGGVRVVNAGSVGMPYENEPGAYWALVGPDVDHRRTVYEPDVGDYPFELPSASRDEAIAFFEQHAVGA